MENLTPAASANNNLSRKIAGGKTTTLGAGVLDAILQLSAQDTTTEESRGKKSVPSGKAKGDKASETKGNKSKSSQSDKTSNRELSSHDTEQNDPQTGGASEAGAKPSTSKDASAKANEFTAIHEKLDHLASALKTMAPVVKEVKKGLRRCP